VTIIDPWMLLVVRVAFSFEISQLPFHQHAVQGMRGRAF